MATRQAKFQTEIQQADSGITYTCDFRLQWTVSDRRCLYCQSCDEGNRQALIVLDSAEDPTGTVPRGSNLFLNLQRIVQAGFLQGAVVCSKDACQARFNVAFVEVGLPAPCPVGS